MTFCGSIEDIYGYMTFARLHVFPRTKYRRSARTEYKRTHEGDDYLGFFGFFDNILKTNNRALTLEEFTLGKKYIQFNPGLESFLRYSEADNYIISSGYIDFLQSLDIAQDIRGIYGTSTKKDTEGRITGSGKIMTDADKISAIKDILNKHGLNEDECENVYYIGDGDTDVPAMKYIHEHGGSAIFVHQPGNDPTQHRLANEQSIDYRCVADYTEGSALWQILNH